MGSPGPFVVWADLMTKVWGLTLQAGQLVHLRAWKQAVWEPTKAWPVMRRTTVAAACLEPSHAPLIAGANFPFGGGVRAR